MAKKFNPFAETSHLKRILGDKLFCIFKRIFDFCTTPDTSKFLNQNFDWTTIDEGVVENKLVVIQLAASDETTALTTGGGKVTFRAPFAFTLAGVRASLTNAQASGSIFTVDINQNLTSLLSTELTIDNTEKTSVTATAPAVISTSTITNDAEISVDIDQIGDGTATGLKITLIGTR